MLSREGRELVILFHFFCVDHRATWEAGEVAGGGKNRVSWQDVVQLGFPVSCPPICSDK